MKNPGSDDPSTSGAPRRGRGRPRTAAADAPTAPVQALDRGLKVLAALAGDGPATLGDLSIDVALPPSSVHRLLATLQRRDFVHFDELRQEWSIGVEAFRTGSAFLVRTNLVEVSRPVLHELVARTAETANLGIVDGDAVVFVAQVETHHPIRAFFRPGTRGPMHASGIGKALLAALDEAALARTLERRPLTRYTARTLTTPAALRDDLAHARARGWACDDEERHEGMRCIAACVHDRHGEAVGGISVSGPTARLGDEALEALGVAVRDGARALTERIGGRVPAPPAGGG